MTPGRIEEIAKNCGGWVGPLTFAEACAAIRIAVAEARKAALTEAAQEIRGAAAIHGLLWAQSGAGNDVLKKEAEILDAISQSILALRDREPR